MIFYKKHAGENMTLTNFAGLWQTLLDFDFSRLVLTWACFSHQKWRWKDDPTIVGLCIYLSIYRSIYLSILSYSVLFCYILFYLSILFHSILSIYLSIYFPITCNPVSWSMFSQCSKPDPWLEAYNRKNNVWHPIWYHWLFILYLCVYVPIYLSSYLAI